MHRLPKRLDENQIRTLAQQVARFHKACSRVSNVLPKSSKTLRTDINTLKDKLDADPLLFGTLEKGDIIKHHCEQFIKYRAKYNAGGFETIPVFIDWNIGNFSVNSRVELYSRWDYDWFRMSSRIMDFYFFSRVVSNAGDKTVFSYLIGPMMESRFMIFLKEYHKINPLTADEVRFMREAYRFFILNYVMKDGRHFFSEQYAIKLQAEAFDIYLPSIDVDFDAEKIIKALKITEPLPAS